MFSLILKIGALIFGSLGKLYLICKIKEVVFIVFSINTFMREISFTFILKLIDFFLFFTELASIFATVCILLCVHIFYDSKY